MGLFEGSGPLLYVYGGVLTVSGVVLRLAERSLEITRRVKDLAGELGREERVGLFDGSGSSCVRWGSHGFRCCVASTTT